MTTLVVALTVAAVSAGTTTLLLQWAYRRRDARFGRWLAREEARRVARLRRILPRGLVHALGGTLDGAGFPLGVRLLPTDGLGGEWIRSDSLLLADTDRGPTFADDLPIATRRWQ